MSYHLFEVFGIELEYMLVDKSTFKVSPIVDQLMIAKNGEIVSDIDNGKIEWSNELVAHVVELKTNGPTADLESLDELFHENILEVNKLLMPLNNQLLPSASHPLMNPESEMQLWKHHYSKIYSLYNRIFDCRGHGWSNVQSMHINLPFYDDVEFAKLHAAIRVLMPLIPALSASSPIFEGELTGYLDSRLQVYKTNQKEIPEMTGRVIPEQVFDRASYFKEIFEPINTAIKPLDTDNILDHHFLNSRGAIARFDRNAIEIRVIDIQECPKADISIAVLLIEAIKLLVSEEWVSLGDQKKWNENELFLIFDDVIKNAENSLIKDEHYLNLFDFGHPVNAGDVWKGIYDRVKDNISLKHKESIEFILKNGSLSTRIIKSLPTNFKKKDITQTYFRLGECLVKNQLFIP